MGDAVQFVSLRGALWTLIAALAGAGSLWTWQTEKQLAAVEEGYGGGMRRENERCATAGKGCAA